MGVGKKLKEWNAASAAFERQRDAGLRDTPLLGSGAGAAHLVATAVKVVAVFVAVVGTVCGIALGRALSDWGRPFGLAVPGWIVIVAAIAVATLLYAVAIGLACLDRLQRDAAR